MNTAQLLIFFGTGSENGEKPTNKKEKSNCSTYFIQILESTSSLAFVNSSPGCYKMDGVNDPAAAATAER